MLYINGKWREASGVLFSSINPATGETLWSGREAVPPEIDEAVRSARQALPSWMRLSVSERTTYLHAFRDELRSNAESLAQQISQEVGKPLWDAATEVQAMIGKIDTSVAALRQRRSSFEITTAGGHGATIYKPHGVMAVFGPFNFPGHIANGQIVPALAAGNTVVLKPSELTPLVAEEMVRIWERAGLPHGVLNLIHGGKSVGEGLIRHQGINGILFTGSLQTGIAIRRSLVEYPEKLLVLELGGNNPLVVHRPSDVSAAIYWTIISAFITGGQRCTCARRLIVTDGNEDFLEGLIQAIRNIRIGPPDSQPQPFLGPLVSPQAADKVSWEQQHLVKEGGKILVEAQRPALGHAYVTPGLIDVTDVEQRPDHEVFGPLLQLIRVSDLDAAIEECNRSQYGLAAALFTEDRVDFDDFLDRVNAGLINWNRPTTGASGELPFGGVGRSGNHRPAGSFAVDFCNIPIASLTAEELTLPKELSPGVVLP
jgi:succinylglutamic semialdehyde dehydrogenase